MSLVGVKLEWRPAPHPGYYAVCGYASATGVIWVVCRNGITAQFFLLPGEFVCSPGNKKYPLADLLLKIWHLEPNSTWPTSVPQLRDRFPQQGDYKRWRRAIRAAFWIGGWEGARAVIDGVLMERQRA